MMGLLPYGIVMGGELFNVPELMAIGGPWLIWRGAKMLKPSWEAARHSFQTIKSIWKAPKLSTKLKLKGSIGAAAGIVGLLWNLIDILWGAEAMAKGISGMARKYGKKKEEERHGYGL